MIEFIYKEFKRNIGAFPVRSFSFIISFICTYFILLVAMLFIKNVFDSFQVLSENYKVSLILSPDFEEIETKNLAHRLKDISPNIQASYIDPATVFESLQSESFGLDLSEQEITDLVPAIAELQFLNLNPIEKVFLSKKIKDEIQSFEEVDQLVVPYPKVQQFVEIYYKNRLGIWIFITALYASIFVLLFLLLSLSLKEHKAKTNLLKILGFKKNYIRGPLILEGVFLSTVGLFFSISILFAICNQIKEEYRELVQIEFFSYPEVLSHLLVNISLVFFLTVLMTQKIIKEDYAEAQ